MVTTNGEGEGDGDVVNSVNGWRGQIGAGISDDFNSHFLYLDYISGFWKTSLTLFYYHSLIDVNGYSKT